MTLGFPRVPLAELLEPLASGRVIQQGWSPQCHAYPTNDPTEWGVLKTTAIQPGRFQQDDHKALPDTLQPRPELEVHVGDLLVTSAGPRARCAVPCLVRATREKLMMSGKMYRIRADASKILPEYLEMYLLSPEAQRALDHMKTGISDSGLNLTHARFLALEVPLPGVELQREIVGTLEAHFSRLDAADRALTMALARLEVLHAATIERCMLQALSHPGTTTRSLGSLGTVGTGATPLKSQRNYYLGGNIPWVTSGDLAQGLISKPTQFITETALDETAVKLWPAGTLLVAMYGEGKTRGTVAELGFESTTNQACAAIVLHDQTPTHRAWVRLVLDSKYQAMRRLASGGVQPNLNLGIVRALEVPVPEDSVAPILLDRCSNQFEAESRLRNELKVSVGRSRSLRTALLRDAFAGVLDGHSPLAAPAREMTNG